MKVYADRITAVVIAAAVIMACLIGLLIYLAFIAEVPPGLSLTARKVVLLLMLIGSLLTRSKPKIHAGIHPQNPYSFKKHGN